MGDEGLVALGKTKRQYCLRRISLIRGNKIQTGAITRFGICNGGRVRQTFVSKSLCQEATTEPFCGIVLGRRAATLGLCRHKEVFDEDSCRL
jgi:hypothetical protein